MAKSTILAAYCAHGLLPVTLPGNDRASLDGFLPGVHYLAGTAEPPTPERLATVAAAAFDWYAGHRLAVHAAGVQRQITEPPPAG